MRVSTLLIPLLALASAAPAQEAPPVFGEVIDVSVINIEAVVTDRSGRLVEGLTAEDFRLLIDGREVPIEYFTEVKAGGALRRGSAELPLDLAPEVAAAQGYVATNYLIFIDDFFAVGARRNLVLRKLAAQLDLLGPDDQAAVLAYDGQRLQILTGWTGSREELRGVLRRATKRKTGGALRRMERRAFLARVADRSGGATLGRAFSPAARSIGGGEEAFPLSILEERAAQLREQVGKLVAATAAGMRGMGDLPGRKVMLLLSGGWPIQADVPEELLSGPSAFTLEARAGTVDLLRFERGAAWYEPLVDTANHLGYTLYPVDVPGLGSSGPGVEENGPGAGGIDTSERAVEQTLLFLARETGGRALLNGLRTQAFERTVEDTRAYYWLGFSFARRADDLRRRVKIEVDRPEVEVRSRRAYVDLSRQAESKMLVEGGLLVDGAESGGPLTVEPGKTDRISRRLVEMPLTVGIPAEAVTLIPIAGRYLADLEISLGVRDRRDVLSDVLVVPVRVAAAGPPSAGDRLYYEIRATLRREPHDLVVTVRDLPTGQLLSHSLRVEP